MAIWPFEFNDSERCPSKWGAEAWAAVPIDLIASIYAHYMDLMPNERTNLLNDGGFEDNCER